MAFENRGNGGGAPTNVPIYTLYPGHRGNTNCGFHGDYPQAPPPKYEDVVGGEAAAVGTSGRAAPHLPTTAEPVGVILVAPAPRYSYPRRLLGVIITLIFCVILVTVFLSGRKY